MAGDTSVEGASENFWVFRTETAYEWRHHFQIPGGQLPQVAPLRAPMSKPLPQSFQLAAIRELLLSLVEPRISTVNRPKVEVSRKAHLQYSWKAEVGSGSKNYKQGSTL